jgi:hypothetical protein
MHWLETFTALVAAFGFGTITSAFISHQTTISTFRQAWINDLRDDLAQYFRSLETLNDVMTDWLNDSVSNDARRNLARTETLTAFEKIRLRLNKTEALHIQLEKKLREFIDQPLGQAMAGRKKIDEAVELARDVLKIEWEVTKHPWRSHWDKDQAVWTDEIL